jgi:hypothetical protein
MSSGCLAESGGRGPGISRQQPVDPKDDALMANARVFAYSNQTGKNSHPASRREISFCASWPAMLVRWILRPTKKARPVFRLGPLLSVNLLG